MAFKFDIVKFILYIINLVSHIQFTQTLLSLHRDVYYYKQILK